MWTLRLREWCTDLEHGRKQSTNGEIAGSVDLSSYSHSPPSLHYSELHLKVLRLCPSIEDTLRE
jgi:hypothetical protein